MKITIISDIHDNMVNLKNCLDWSRKNTVEKILCLGDITNSETLDYLARNFSGEIFLVAGNCELYPASDLKKYPNIKYLGEVGSIEIDGLKFGLVHQPAKIERLSGNYDFIFHGHTHKPWIENKNGVTIANPGNISGTIYKVSFATLDTSTKKLELMILENI
jgi:hypothetical protein